MNAAHLHLILNHIPVLGTVFGLLLLAYAFRSTDEMKKVSFSVLALTALIAIPVLITGHRAAEIVMELPDVPVELIEQHESVATAAFVSLMIVGVAAVVGLVRFRHGKAVRPWFAGMVLALALVTSVLMALAALAGGKIRHTEIRPETSHATLPEKE